jgi:calcium-dependent protein kinase
MIAPAEKRINSQQVLDHPWVKKYTGQEETVELPQIVTINLKKFKSAERVKKVVLSYLATQLSEKEMEPIKKLFVALDKNGDGKLSMEEIESGLKGKEHSKELVELVKSMDTDKSGFIDYNEFIAAAIGDEIYLNKNKLKQAFNMFDKVKYKENIRIEVERSTATN